MNKSVVIVGASGHGKVVADGYIRSIYHYFLLYLAWFLV